RLRCRIGLHRQRNRQQKCAGNCKRENSSHDFSLRFLKTVPANSDGEQSSGDTEYCPECTASFPSQPLRSDWQAFIFSILGASACYRPMNPGTSPSVTRWLKPAIGSRLDFGALHGSKNRRFSIG